MNIHNLVKHIKTSDLLALYNALLNKSTTKFASRENGEKQVVGAAKVAGAEVVAKLVADLGIKLENQEPISQPEPTKVAEPVAATPAPTKKARKPRETNPKADTKARVLVGHCPACNADTDQTAAGAEGTVAGDERNFCHVCSTEYWRATGKVFNRRKPGKDLGKSISASWKDAEVRAARSARNGVTVHEKGDAANKTTYKSVAEAFRQLRLPMAKHIKLRMEVKDVGSAEFEHGKKVLVFKLIDKA